MANVGDRFKTGETCDTRGAYIFDGYVQREPPPPVPTAIERVIPLSKGETFPPIRSSSMAAYWKLQRVSP